MSEYFFSLFTYHSSLCLWYSVHTGPKGRSFCLSQGFCTLCSFCLGCSSFCMSSWCTLSIMCFLKCHPLIEVCLPILIDLLVSVLAEAAQHKQSVGVNWLGNFDLAIESVLSTSVAVPWLWRSCRCVLLNPGGAICPGAPHHCPLGDTERKLVISYYKRKRYCWPVELVKVFGSPEGMLWASCSSFAATFSDRKNDFMYLQ